jgi:hypothetical protein
MHRANVLALSVFFLVGLGPPQKPPPAERDDRPELSKAARLANRKTEKALQGAWRLVEMRLVPNDSAGLNQGELDHVGFCLFSGHYFSVEFHLRLLGGGQLDMGVPGDRREQGRSFVSGLHLFELDEDGAMETSTVIGARTDEDGTTAFEPPETKRHYTIEVEGDTLTMRREDGHTLMFERLRDDRSRFDFFGAPLPDPAFYDDEPAKKDQEKEKKDDRDEDG